MLEVSLSARDLALSTGFPVAVVRIAADGAVVVERANEGMTELLGAAPRGLARARLADLVVEDDRSRLAAAARDLVSLRGHSVTLRVRVEVRGRPQDVELSLLTRPVRGIARLPRPAWWGDRTRAVLHGRCAESPHPQGTGADVDGRTHLVDRLEAALGRVRRRAARVSLVVARLGWPESVERPDAAALGTAQLADRARQAVRDTDTVVQLGMGWLAVLVEEPADGGEVVLARRLLDVLTRSRSGAARPTVDVAVTQVSDPDADPDVVIDHLQRSAEAAVGGEGVSVVPPWTSQVGDRPGTGPEAGRDDRIGEVLRSGRFVLGRRSLHPLGLAAAGTSVAGTHSRTFGPPAPSTTLVEVCTSDEGLLTPVRVTAPGLAVALDRWALQQAGAGDLGEIEPLLVVRLQPGGVLGLAIEEDLEDLLRRRPGTRVVLQVPEERLEEAASAQRAVLDRLPRLGVGLAVAGWSGRLDVRALVRWRVELVQLSPRCQEDAVRPEGAALLTGLVAGLHAGLGPAAWVVAEEPRDAAVGQALAGCGVGWLALPTDERREAA